MRTKEELVLFLKGPIELSRKRRCCVSEEFPQLRHTGLEESTRHRMRSFERKCLCKICITCKGNTSSHWLIGCTESRGEMQREWAGTKPVEMANVGIILLSTRKFYRTHVSLTVKQLCQKKGELLSLLVPSTPSCYSHKDYEIQLHCYC